MLDDLAHGKPAGLECGPTREDIDDPGLLLAGVPAALYHHPQAVAVLLPHLDLHQVRPGLAGPVSPRLGRKVNIKTFLGKMGEHQTGILNTATTSNLLTQPGGLKFLLWSSRPAGLHF